MKIQFQVFRGIFSSWETLFKQAAEYAAAIGKDRLINISHSENHVEGVVTVWYWSEK